ncbi:MAG: 2'-5' RNA ligase family protein [Gaiellaceae bacterium]
MSGAASVGGDERLRLFLGYVLPEQCRESVRAWQQAELASGGGRLVPPEHLHFTVAFLGARPASELDAIGAALRECAAGAMRSPLELARYRETRSVGMLVFNDPEGGLTRAAIALQSALEQLGVYRPEARPWLPHVTVLRFRRPPRLRPSLPDLGRVSPSEVAAYHSLLRRGGAQYVVLESAVLGG